MKKYTLIPKGEGDTITDLNDETETNGKLVLPLVDGEYTLIVEGITTEEARLFRKAQANLDDKAGLADTAKPGDETLPAAFLPPTEFTGGDIALAAEAAHAANKAYCESLGDTSQPDWADAPTWQKDSAINGVKFALANSFPSPEAMHQNWYDKKLADGWIYGEVKDPEKKTHPCMVHYDELPEQQRRKDDIFRATIMAALGKAPPPQQVG